MVCTAGMTLVLNSSAFAGVFTMALALSLPLTAVAGTTSGNFTLQLLPSPSHTPQLSNLPDAQQSRSLVSTPAQHVPSAAILVALPPHTPHTSSVCPAAQHWPSLSSEPLQHAPAAVSTPAQHVPSAAITPLQLSGVPQSRPLKPVLHVHTSWAHVPWPEQRPIGPEQTLSGHRCVLHGVDVFTRL